MTDRKFWAEVTIGRETFREGPFSSRNVAEIAAVDTLGKAVRARGHAWITRNRFKKFTILSGYGEFGPHFDIQFKDFTLDDLVI